MGAQIVFGTGIVLISSGLVLGSIQWIFLGIVLVLLAFGM
jgi:hypothetical protein